VKKERVGLIHHVFLLLLLLHVVPSSSIRDMGANRLGTLNKDAFKGMILLNEL
jgi:hypothetical protein